MMVSNALSARRGPLRRPKVCLTHPNPGRCEPPFPPLLITCNVFLAEEGPYYTGEEISLGWDACNPDFPEPLILSPEMTAVIGEIVDVEDAENCSGENDAFYEAPDDPGIEVITMTVTWPDSSTCQSVLTFPVIEEPDED